MAQRPVPAEISQDVQRTIRERMEGGKLFPAYLGVKVGALARGYAELKLALRPELLQYQGVAHGGVLAALADTAVAVALMSEVGLAMNFTTVDLHMFYFAPARGATIHARARIVKPGRRINVGEVDIEDEAGKLLARSVVTYILLEARP